jgi:hypothetical protein
MSIPIVHGAHPTAIVDAFYPSAQAAAPIVPGAHSPSGRTAYTATLCILPRGRSLRHLWLGGHASFGHGASQSLLRSSPGWPSVATRLTHALRPLPIVRADILTFSQMLKPRRPPYLIEKSGLTRSGSRFLPHLAGSLFVFRSDRVFPHSYVDNLPDCLRR